MYTFLCSHNVVSVGHKIPSEYVFISNRLHVVLFEFEIFVKKWQFLFEIRRNVYKPQKNIFFYEKNFFQNKEKKKTFFKYFFSIIFFNFWKKFKKTWKTFFCKNKLIFFIFSCDVFVNRTVTNRLNFFSKRMFESLVLSVF